jgi:hypothetical protein
MSIFATADDFHMTVYDIPGQPERDDLVAMQLLADGVPLALLVDLALPTGLQVDATGDSELTGTP